MKTLTNKILLVLFVFTALTFTNCTVRLVDFTTISTKNVNLGVDRKMGKKTKGSKTYFLGFGFNLKDAIDIALESAGTEYDMLIDGVVRYSNYPFVIVVKVEGVAVSTSDIKKSMGDADYKKWLENQNNVYEKIEDTGDSKE